MRTSHKSDNSLTIAKRGALCHQVVTLYIVGFRVVYARESREYNGVGGGRGKGYMYLKIALAEYDADDPRYSVHSTDVYEAPKGTHLVP